MLISVIVPHYNHAPYIKQRMDSILQQTYPEFEIILLDDASTDGSREILLSYAQHPKVSHCVINEVNSGSTFSQWKKGIALAKGELIWIAESDDISDPEFLSCLQNRLSAAPQVQMAVCNLITINDESQSLSRRTYYPNKIWDSKDLLIHEFTRGNYIWNVSSVLFRRTAFDAVRWEQIENMRFCGDWLFYVQIIEQAQCLTVSEALNQFRVHQQTVSKHPQSAHWTFSEGLIAVHHILQLYSISPLQRILICKHWLEKIRESNFDAETIVKVISLIQQTFGTQIVNTSRTGFWFWHFLSKLQQGMRALLNLSKKQNESR
jgi:hypothetical protein